MSIENNSKNSGYTEEPRGPNFIEGLFTKKATIVRTSTTEDLSLGERGLRLVGFALACILIVPPLASKRVRELWKEFRTGHSITYHDERIHVVAESVLKSHKDTQPSPSLLEERRPPSTPPLETNLPAPPPDSHKTPDLPVEDMRADHSQRPVEDPTIMRAVEPFTFPAPQPTSTRDEFPHQREQTQPPPPTSHLVPTTSAFSTGWPLPQGLELKGSPPYQPELERFITGWATIPHYDYSKKALYFKDFILRLLEKDIGEEEIIRNVGYVINKLIQNKQIVAGDISEIEYELKKLLVPESKASIKIKLIEKIQAKKISSTIIDSYRSSIFLGMYEEGTFQKKTEVAYEDLRRQLSKITNFSQDHKIRKDIDANTASDILSNMLICTINLDNYDRDKINDLLAKGLQIIRVLVMNSGQAGDIPYNSTGTSGHVLSRLFTFYLKKSKADIAISYYQVKQEKKVKSKHQDQQQSVEPKGELIKHYPFPEDNRGSPSSIPFVSDHFQRDRNHCVNKIYDFKTKKIRVCDNLVPSRRFEDMPEEGTEGQFGYWGYIPQAVVDKIKNNEHLLDNLCIPRWEAQNCYLSSGWIEFAVSLYIYTCAYEAELKGLEGD